MINPALAEALGLRPTAPQEQDTRSWPERVQDQIKRDGPAEYQPAWQEHQQNLADGNARLQRQLQQGAHADRGLAIILSGNTAGLPVDLVERAQAAGAAAKQAAARHIELMTEADQYISIHGLRPEAGAIHKELHCAEAATRRRETDEAARRACMQLGAAAEQVEQARAVLAAESARRAANDAQWDVTENQIAADVAAAKRVLRDLGV